MKTSKQLRNLRWPILLLLPLIILALVFWKTSDRQIENSAQQTSASPLSWFCPILDQLQPLRLLNPTAVNTTARVTIYSSRFETDRAVESVPYLSGAFEVEVPRLGSELIFAYSLLGDATTSRSNLFLSALVEFAQPGPVADPSLCINQSSEEWMFPAGSTHRDACYFLSVFNPFANVAVVDIQFATDDGVRNLVEGAVVPASSTLTIDIGEEVVRREHFAAHLTTRVGKVVVGKLQTFTGASLELERNCPRQPYPFPTDPSADFSRVWGSSILLGAPMAQRVWYFPQGTNPFVTATYAVYNPNSEVADVELTIMPEVGASATKTFTIPAFQRVAIKISGDAFHPLPKLPKVIDPPSLRTSNLRNWAKFKANQNIVASKVQTNLRTPFGLVEELGLVEPTRQALIYKHQLNFIVEGDLETGLVAIANPSETTIAFINLPGILNNVEIPPLGRYLLRVAKNDLADSQLLGATSPVLIAPFR